jgi:3-oxoadipate enol-lactonase
MTSASTKTVTTGLGRVSYGESGNGQTLVILHSLLTDRHAFDRVTADLPGRVVSLDLPGFGESDRSDPSIEAFADLMAAAAEQVCRDGEAPIVMGNGLGAFVTLGMAIRHRDLVKKMVLVGCGAKFPEEARPAFRKMIDLVSADGMGGVTPLALRRIYTEDYLDTHPDEAEERARVLAETDPEAFVDACQALYELDFSDRVGALDTPTQIVVGEDDGATPPEMAASLHDLLPDSRLSVLPGVAHAPQLQDPGGFLAAIRSFVTP